MKRRNRAQTSSLFLLELILAILFFSLASAVCVQFFVQSHILSRDAQSLNHAVNECSGIAEIVYSSRDLEDAAESIFSVYPQAQRKEDPSTSIRIWYDSDFLPCEEPEGSYLLQADLSEKDDMLDAEIALTKSEDPGEEIYRLHASHYLQRRDDNGEK